MTDAKAQAYLQYCARVPKKSITFIIFTYVGKKVIANFTVEYFYSVELSRPKGFFSAKSRPLPDVAYLNFSEPKRKVPVGRHCCEAGMDFLKHSYL